MSDSPSAVFSRVLPPSDQVAALGDSVGHLAHDFNNLLAAISGSASLIEMLNDTHPETPRHVRNIQGATARGAKIMQQLLALSPKTDAPFESEFVSELLHDARQRAGDQAESGHIFTFFAAEGIPPLACDRRQVQLVLDNLIQNARDAAPAGGAIVVTARLKHLDATELSAAANGSTPTAGDYVALTVQDNGPGIAPAAQTRLGELFFTTKPKGKGGGGLGLAIASRITRRHGGFVLVESEAGAGTRVTGHFALGAPRAN